MVLASLGGCMTTNQPSTNALTKNQRPAAASPSYQGPYGEPIGTGNNPAVGMSPGMAPTPGFIAGTNPKPGSDLIQLGYLKRDDDTDSGVRQAGHEMSHNPGEPYYHSKQGIVPVPAMGPPGAVPALGALPARMPQQPMNMRTSVNFASPDGMRVTWYGPAGWSEQPLVTPARYNFLQGGVYRLRMSSVANRLEKVYYPTLEVCPGNEKTAAYLAHSSVPVTVTDEDFEQVDSGNFLIKVVYLPDLHNQDLAVASGPNELVSTRLEPGIDPIVEAQRRGTIMLIVRMGNIDLNTPNSPAMDAPSPFMTRGMPMGAPPVEKKEQFSPIPIPYPKSVNDKKVDDKKVDDKRPAQLPAIQ